MNNIYGGLATASSLPHVGHGGDRLATHRTAALTALFALTLLLGSALLFVVEPMFARMILPQLGGSPAVWNTCLVFFQAALLGGYAYAHLLTRLLAVRTQVIVHVTLVLFAAMALPVGPSPDWLPPVNTSPIPWLLMILAAGVGAPFTVLSATSPLLQHWFAHGDHPAARDPYHLYASSNVGSIAALLGYPFLIEPFLSLTQQRSTWTFAYWMFAALVVACATVAARFGTAVTSECVDEETAAVCRVSWKDRATWLVLAIVPSSLLLSVTTYLSTDVAAIPLLWVAPLALYLLTFVSAFARRQLIPPRLAERALPLALIPLVLLMTTAPGGVVLLLFPLHLTVFFLCALTLHTGLARRRPARGHLTEFYLWIGAGGVLGGLLNTLIAPLIFTGVTEYPVGLIAACVVQQLARQHAKSPFTWSDFLFPALVGGAVVSASTGARLNVLHPGLFIAIMAGLGMLSFSFSRRPIRFSLAIAALLVMRIAPITETGLVYAQRTFFGVLRVQHDGSPSRHLLLHGSTVHGQQDLRPEFRSEPLTYYHRSGPIGQVLAALAPSLDRAHIGVVGLGAGSLAAYARRDQQWTFFEIDPAVVKIARDPQLFTYLEPCGDRCRVVLGDARLSLARDEQSDRFSLLVLDAFSSDAIPVHLVTREALALYLSKLTADGLLAFHISNRHLDLEPVLSSLATEQGLIALAQYDKGSKTPDIDGHFASRWLIVARRADALGPLMSDPRWHRVRSSPRTRAWTDDYSNIVTVLNIKQ